MPVVRLRKKGDAKAHLAKLKKSLSGPTHVKVGFPQGEAKDDIIAIAAYNNFGTSRGIPPRPFMSSGFKKEASKLKDITKREAKAVFEGNRTMRQGLDRLGLGGVGIIQREIVALKEPPNHPDTIARKGSSNPLIDTGAMLGSVTHKVE